MDLSVAGATIDTGMLNRFAVVGDFYLITHVYTILLSAINILYLFIFCENKHDYPIAIATHHIWCGLSDC